MQEKDSSEKRLRILERHNEALRGISRSLANLEDSDSFLKNICETVVDVVGGSWASVIILDIPRNLIRANVIATRGEPLEPLQSFQEIQEGLAGWAIRVRRPTLSVGTEPDPRESEAVRVKRYKNRVGSLMVAPLIHQEEVLGTVTAGRLLGEEEFEDQDLELIDAIAHQAALAVHTQDLYAEQRRKSAEREVLLQEIHHRVKNNLNVIVSLARLHRDQVEDPTMAPPFDDLIRRIYSMALIHDKLWEHTDAGIVAVPRYMRELVDNLAVLIDGPRPTVEIRLELEDVSLDIDTLVSLGLVATELLANSLEHAFPKEQEPASQEERLLTLRFYESEQAFHLEVVDNGEGMEKEGCPAGGDRGLGLCLVESMVEQLSAQLERIPADGTGWGVTIPKRSRGGLNWTGATSS